MVVPLWWFILYGFIAGAVLAALWYEPRWRIRMVLWFMIGAHVCFAIGWRLYGHYHPEVYIWPSA